jgi:acetyl/propionyl-CoA carboxylase alpha subunit
MERPVNDSRALATRIGSGMYRVEHEGRVDVVYAAGDWLFWDGRVFYRPFAEDTPRTRRANPDAHQALSAPMPATVLKILVAPGASVRKGDTLLILEAMKMELPVRAPADAVVRGIAFKEGDLVQAGTVLVELN